MIYLQGTGNHLEDTHERMEDIFRHEAKTLESYLTETVALKGERQ